MNKIKIILMLMLLLVILSFSQNSNFVVAENVIPGAEENIEVTINVDGFESKADWNVRYSKFRSITWNLDANRETGEIKRAQQKESSESWWDIFFATINNDFLSPDLPEYISKVEKGVLGLRGRFDIQDNNWVIIEPAYSRLAGKLAGQQKEYRHYLDEPSALKHNPRSYRKPYFIEIQEVTKSLSVWVFGCNRNYILEMHIEDFFGSTYTVPITSLDFQEWRFFEVELPKHAFYSQTTKRTTNPKPIKFIRLKVNIPPESRVDDFYLFFDIIQAKTIYTGDVVNDKFKTDLIEGLEK